MEHTILVCLIAAAVVQLAAIFFLLAGQSRQKRENDSLRRELSDQLTSTRQELNHTVQEAVASLGRTLSDAQAGTAGRQDVILKNLGEQLSQRNDDLRKTVSENLNLLNSQTERSSELLRTTLTENMASVRRTMDERLDFLQKDNAEKLEQMRRTVDEKLENTLNQRLTQSFRQVSEQLEKVYKGLGEMQTLATGVGDLKKVLSNVKTRGILGEIQLGAILEQILSPEQYATNVVTVAGSRDPVEYAVKLPGDGEGTVWLPIDAKFPGDTYAALVDAYDSAEPERIAQARRDLTARIKGCAKDIRDKYIGPPDTTDFAIMFLPFEGLYAEVVNLDMVEVLSRDYKVNIAGPTTMAALLNSLQMGFRTLAIQKRSGEVWRVLGAVKTEFEKFSKCLEKVQDRIRAADQEVDRLIHTRTNVMNRTLRSVEKLDAQQSQTLLGLSDMPEGEDD